MLVAYFGITAMLLMITSYIAILYVDRKITDNEIELRAIRIYGKCKGEILYREKREVKLESIREKLVLLLVLGGVVFIGALFYAEVP